MNEAAVAQSSERSISPAAWPSFRRSVNRLRSAGETLARSAAISGSVEPNSQMAPTPMQPSARISSLLLISPNSSAWTPAIGDAAPLRRERRRDFGAKRRSCLGQRRSSGVARLRIIWRKDLVGSAWAQSKDRSQNQRPGDPSSCFSDEQRDARAA
jgi:hypothetical protein